MAFLSILTKLFGSHNQRLIKKMAKVVQQINLLETQWSTLTDEQLQAKTADFKQRLANGEHLDKLLPEAFATVREAAKRVANMRHFDVQLIAGMVLHHNKIAEAGTGEGKTLVATLPAYLNALTGKGVHVVTVNDYLARRDAEWMGPIYRFLGLTVGVIHAGMPHQEKKEAYNADITYGTNNEYGFDYLRDNMAFSKEDKVQRQLNFAIVDEVDSILIDEARTPLIISGPSEDSSELYKRIDKIIPKLQRQEKEDGEGDYFVDEKSKQVYLNEVGHEHIEHLLVDEGILEPDQNLYDPESIIYLHHVNAALRAHTLFQRDIDYIVRDDEVIIVDEHTGRTMPGRRWSDGLHQATEAKEGVMIQRENQTLASITFQNYFRLYNKLAGMTGTADTEAYEFQQIYGLEVVVIPTNKPNQRKDLSDLVYINQAAKFNAVIEDIKACRQRQQPVLVGTASIETSEYLSKMLDKEKIPHQVLNAKFHEKEAQIIAQAGRPGSVTIATNMAGRGTDIVLGGNPEQELVALGPDATQEQKDAAMKQWQERHDNVLLAGGLHVIGSERHESRRIDNQLRGRSARQGDPGSTRFYLSLEDNLMRIFASPALVSMMQKLGMDEEQAIESGMVTRAIENAQRKVEGRNFDIRKQLLQFDDVANEQRKVIYTQRNELLDAEDIGVYIADLRIHIIDELIKEHMPPQSLEEQWDVDGLQQKLNNDFGLELSLQQWLDEQNDLDQTGLSQKILDEMLSAYQEKEAQVGESVLRHFEKSIMLQTLDMHWKEHLASMDYLRQSISLRGYAQKDPKQEYKREAFLMFTSLLDRIKFEVIALLTKFQVRKEEDVEKIDDARRKVTEQETVQFQHEELDSFESDEIKLKPTPFTRTQPKVGRNDSCFCGSGKKYKHCHGKLT